MLLSFMVCGVVACNALAGIETGQLGLCADGSRMDAKNCENVGPSGAGGENGGNSTDGGAGVSCDAPWQRGGPITGRCYLQEYVPREWALAEQRCIDLGGHLVAIDSANELEYLDDWITSNVWTGGSDATNEGIFVWTNGQPWLYASWKDGVPIDPNGNRDCVMLSAPNSSVPVFNCRACTEKHAYICESPPINP